MFEKLSRMRDKLLPMLRGSRISKRPCRLGLECLEGRVVPALYLWIGGTVGDAVNLASTQSNWWVWNPTTIRWGAAAALPGATDDLLFEQGGVTWIGAGNSVPGNPCNWDAKAPAAVNSITIGGTAPAPIGGTYSYGSTITLNRDLTVN
jgi:hypothetical protein